MPQSYQRPMNYLPFPPRYDQTYATLSYLTGQPERVYASLEKLYRAQLGAYAQSYPDCQMTAEHPATFRPDFTLQAAGLADAEAHLQEALYTTVVKGRSQLEATDAAELMQLYELARASGLDSGAVERRVGNYKLTEHVLDQIAERWGEHHPQRVSHLIQKTLSTGEVRPGQNSTKYMVKRSNGIYRVLHVLQDTVVTASNYRTGAARKRLFGL